MIAIKNGKIVTPQRIIEDHTLFINDDIIVGYAADSRLVNGHFIDETINAHGRYIMPGLIDVHSDKIEQYVRPRPMSQMDFEFALKVCERDLLGVGITTMYHSLSLYKDEAFGKCLLNTKENVQEIADVIDSMRTRRHLIRHKLHLRIELDNPDAFDIACDIIKHRKVHLISFMDHTPGQGQYSDPAIYRDTISEYGGKEISELGIEGVMRRHKDKEMLSIEQLKELARLAHENGLSVASHDDDTEEKLLLNKEIGVDISEFPVTAEAARAAKANNLYTVVGAANILRNGSHSGNLSASQAVIEDCADIICSDYYPAAILHSIFHMYAKHAIPLPKMVNKATLNPAAAMRIDDDFGSIEPDKKADLLIVDTADGSPVVTHAIMNGIVVSRIEYVD